MRKLIAMLTALMLLLTAVPCFAESDAASTAEDDPVLADFTVFAQQALDELTESATGWSKYILSMTKITGVEYTSRNKYITAWLAAPSVLLDRQAETLAGAMAHYMTGDVTVKLKLAASWNQNEDGTCTFTWSQSKPNALHSSAKNLASKAKKGYTIKSFLALCNAEIFPKGAEMPSKEPTEVPELAALSDAYTASAAEGLGITQEQAAGRLPSLLMLMEITKLDTTEPLSEAVATLRVKDWASMLDQAEEKAKELLGTLLGVKNMSRDQIEAVYWQAMNVSWLDAYYGEKKTQTTATVALDLPGTVESGVGASTELMDYLSQCMAAIDDHVTSLMEYGATLPYYPAIDLIDTGVLTGAQDENGVRVSFDMGSDTMDHAWLKIVRGGTEVLTAFVHNNSRCNLRLDPGSYTVYYGMGPDWYGERYLFGAGSSYGCFDLTVTDADQTTVHLQNTAEGTLALTPVTWTDLCEGE